MIFSGAGARLARQGALDMTTELLEALQPLRQHLQIGAAQLSGAGPVHLPFTLRMRVSELNPSRWLGTPYPKLNYLNAASRSSAPASSSAASSGCLTGLNRFACHRRRVSRASASVRFKALTWSLGPQRTLRFVHP